MPFILKVLCLTAMVLQRMLFRKYLDKGEQLIYIVHKHWISVHRQMIKIAFFGYLSPILMMVFLTGFWSPASSIFWAWLVVAGLRTVYEFLDWYLDAWLVTDVSIIDTEWDGFFKQRSSRVDYESIESVDIDFKGLRQSVMNFGTITLIRSSGVHLTMKRCYKPQLASSMISQVHSEMVSQKGVQDSEALKGILADIIQDHIKVNS